MAEVTIESLQNIIEQMKNNFKGNTAQLEATNQMLNEQLQLNLQLRSNAILINQAYQQLVTETSKLKDEVQTLKNQSCDLIAKINELSLPPVEQV